VKFVDSNSGTTLGTVALNSSGVAVFTSTTLAIGDYDVTAQYAGDSQYLAANSTDVTFSVVPKVATIALQSSAATANYGTLITLTATVAGTSGTPTGSVVFTANGVTLGTVALSSGGVAALTTTNLGAGANGVVAAYSGGSGYGAVSSSLVTVTIHAGVLKFLPANASTYAGTPSDNQHGAFADGAVGTARFHTPYGMAIAPNGDLYVADQENNAIRVVQAGTGNVTTVAGRPHTTNFNNPVFGGDNYPAIFAYLANPSAVAFDSAGNYYIADYSNNAIRKVTVATAIITTVAGMPQNAGHNVDSGVATAVQLNNPVAVIFDKADNMYIADRGNNLIRRVDPSGALTTIAGRYGYQAPNRPDSGVLATNAVLNKPSGLALDAAGNLYISDTYDQVIRRVEASTGIITTIAGGSTNYVTNLGDGGPATSATLNYPQQMAVDLAGNLYIADNANNLIRRVDSSGKITSVAGVYNSQASPYHVDPAGAAATTVTLAAPNGVAVDGAGNLYVADTFNQTILQVGATSTVVFGTQAVGTTSDPKELTLFNAGDSPISFNAGAAFSTTGDFALAAGGSSPCSFGAGLAVGVSCTVNVTYSPKSAGSVAVTGAFASSAVGHTQTVNFISKSATTASTMTLSLGSNPATYGDAEQLLGQPTGTVKFLDGTVLVGSATIASGYASIQPTTLAVGTHTIMAVYSGDATYLGSTSDPQTLVVRAKPLTATANDATRVYGVINPTFTGTLPATVNGDVLTLGFSTAAVTTSPAGVYAIVPSVTGSAVAKYVVTANSGKLKVTQAATSVVVASTLTPAGTGVSVTLTATVNSAMTGIHDGTVTFCDGRTALGAALTLNTSGIATLQTPSLGVGTHSITAQYGRGENYVGATSAVFSQVVLATD